MDSAVVTELLRAHHANKTSEEGEEKIWTSEQNNIFSYAHITKETGANNNVRWLYRQHGFSLVYKYAGLIHLIRVQNWRWTYNTMIKPVCLVRESLVTPLVV